MSGRQNDELSIRRILVALDASRNSLAALEAAAELAASLEADVEGLFVEDVNLLRVAVSPVARAVQYPFGGTADLDRRQMERQLRALASQARQALAATCDRRRIRWSFRVVRGEVISEVLAATDEADLLSLGRMSRSLGQRRSLGSTARAAAAQALKPVLFIQKDVDIEPPVVIAYDGSDAGGRALALAARLARSLRGEIVVLALAATREGTGRVAQQARDWLRGRDLTVVYRPVVAKSPRGLIHGISSGRSGVLIVSDTVVSPEPLEKVLDQVNCPLLVVR